MVIITRDIIMRYYITSTSINKKDETIYEINKERLYKSGYQIIYDIDWNKYKCIKSSEILTENYAVCIDTYFPESIISLMLKAINIQEPINIYSSSRKKYKNVININF